MTKTNAINKLIKELEFYYRECDWDKYDNTFEKLRKLGAFV